MLIDSIVRRWLAEFNDGLAQHASNIEGDMFSYVRDQTGLPFKAANYLVDNLFYILVWRKEWLIKAGLHEFVSADLWVELVKLCREREDVSSELLKIERMINTPEIRERFA